MLSKLIRPTLRAGIDIFRGVTDLLRPCFILGKLMQTLVTLPHPPDVRELPAIKFGSAFLSEG